MEYCEEIKKQIELYERRIEQTKLLDEDLQIVRRLYPKISVWLDHEINIAWGAKSMDEVKDMLKTFAKEGLMLDENGYQASDTSPVWYLKGKNVNIRLQPYWSTNEEEGQTCKLVQIGEDVVRRPIYKLVCDKDKE